ncbi:OmpH family outer membrane protein [Millionella massiliensis]|uniref:OmpH family outer membrane protein n=1 Tax=Millionella massiliensis TaxID=1871023 RepID=UPI0008DB328A|nr:OmpH family outer membrane protein [Millionella massiliensis]
MKTSQKLILALVAVAAFLFVGTGAANAQQKFGYINSQELLSSMPEIDSVQSKVSALGKDLESQFTAMQTEMTTKAQELQSNMNTLSETVRKQKEKELFDLQTRIEEFNRSAQQELQTKQQELLKPVMEKAQAAITKVAKEQNLTAVFDVAAGALIYQNESQMVNLLPLVKQSLGIQ